MKAEERRDTWTQFSPERIAPGVWLARDVLTHAETTGIIARAEAAGFANAQLSSSGRNNSEVFLQDAAIRELLAARLEPLLDVPVNLPAFFECYRYHPGESVAPHTDSPTKIGGVLSTLTLVVYLNDNFEGGATHFPHLPLVVPARAGAGLFFEHVLKHGGTTVEAGTKYILRTAVALIQ